MTTTTTTTPSTITIGKRTFEVERTTRGGEVVYILRGPRGATYATMRNAHTPAVMFLVTMRGFGMAAGYESIRLTDTNGALEVMRGMYR